MQTEEELHKFVESNILLNDQNNWKPYGGQYGNYSSFENQQSTSMAALIEKLTNSIDATLTRKCYEKDLSPEDPKAPKTMKEAVNTFFTKEEIKSSHLRVFTDGTKDNVNVISVDEGEGQLPDDFEDTFLSLQKGNKNKIKFVQGKYNMGSTGAVVFCGKYKYQLIASKRHTSLETNNTYVGFTLVRKHIRIGNEINEYKNTWYEYFTINDKIPRFELKKGSSINIIKDMPESSFKQGSIVKMYNYALPSKTQSFQSLKLEINKLLYYPAFPIDVYETRDSFKIVKKRNGVMNVAYGNGEILQKNLDKTTPIYREEGIEISDMIFGTAKINLFVFETEKDAKDIRGNMPVVFLMNGQVQYSQGTSFISNKLGFKLLKKTLIIIIDCTNLSTNFLDEGLFMANRETIRQTTNNEYFINCIIENLKSNENLIRINREKATKQVSNASTNKLLVGLLGNNKNSSLLKSLFSEGVNGVEPTKSNGSNQKSKEKEEFQLLEKPTFMKVNNLNVGEGSETVKSYPINKNINLNIELNAVDNYFIRDDNPGKLSLKIRDMKKVDKEKKGNKPGDGKDFGEAFTITKSALQKGHMKLYLEPKTSFISVGDEVQIQINLHDEQCDFTHIVRMKFIDQEDKSPKDRKKTQKGTLELPPLIQVYKDQETIDKLDIPDEEKQEYKTWQDVEWEDEIAPSKIVKLEPGINEEQPISCVFINMSSNALQQLLVEEGTTGTKGALAKNQFITQIYMQSFLTAAAIFKMEKNNANELIVNIEMEDFIAKMIEETAYINVKMQVNNILNVKELEVV